MAQPASPIPIGVSVLSADSLALSGATVTITFGDETSSETTDSDGKTILNGSEVSAIVGDTITITASKSGYGKYSRSLVLAATQQVILTLAYTSDYAFYIEEDNLDRFILRGAMLVDFEGNKITPTNPLPTVDTTNPIGSGNPSYTFSRNSEDSVITIVMSLNSVTYTMTITRDSNDNVTAISSWVLS